MRTLQIIAGIAMLCVAGCAHHEDHFTPPSSVAVQRSVARVAEYVRPEGKKAYKDLQRSLTDYQAQVEEQTIQLEKAEKEALYWRDKQSKALRELWVWRGIALISIALVVGYIGIKTAWKFAI